LTDFRSAIFPLLAAIALACTESESPPEAPPKVPKALWVEIAGEPFELELALDAASRHFLDFSGEVVTIHEMRPELPRRPGESQREYESRLRVYESGAPVGFAIETAGGRLDEVGLRVGDSVVFDIARVLELARRVEGQRL